MARRNPWAFKVTKAEREIEIKQNDIIVRLIDELLPAVKSDGTAYLIQELVIENEANARAFGLSLDDARKLSYVVNDMCPDPEWLGDTDDMPSGTYQAGNAVWDNVQEKFALLDCNPTTWPERRKNAMRRRAAAKRAIQDGRAV